MTETSLQTTHQFTVHLGGLIELLSDALYTSETVFVREVLQNSVDACTARRSLEPNYKGRISIEVTEAEDGGPLRLTVEDDGIGVLEEEVHQFLATIGASTKRSDLERQRNSDFLGQFGIGLLSCFMVADEITLVSRSARASGTGLCWQGRKDGSYSLKAIDTPVPIGTAVYLTLNADTREHYDAERIVDLARKYGGFLPVPIEFRTGLGKPRAVNSAPFPWDRPSSKSGHRRKQWLDFAEKSLGEKALTAFPIETAEGGVRGMCCLMREPVGALTVPRHTLYLKGMFLTREGDGLAPRTMPFLRCIVNATALKPNAAREGLQDAEDALWSVREAVAAGFRAHLRALEEDSPRELEDILRIHHQSFLKVAAEDADFLRLIGPYLEFETTLGRRKLAELRQRFAPLLYIPDYEDYRRAEPFAAAHNVVVVNAGYAGAAEIFRKLSHYFPQERFEATSASELREQFSVEPELSPTRHRLLVEARAALRAVRCDVRLVEDAQCRQPASLEVPASTAFARRQATEGEDDFLSELESQGFARPTLDLNLSHPCIERLAQGAAPDQVRTVVQILYHTALLASRETPAVLECEQFTSALETILAGFKYSAPHLAVPA